MTPKADTASHVKLPETGRPGLRRSSSRIRQHCESEYSHYINSQEAEVGEMPSSLQYPALIMRLVFLLAVITIATASDATWKILGTASSTSTAVSQPRAAERRGFSFPKLPEDDPPVRPEPYSVNDGEPGAVENGPAHLSIPESSFHKPTPTPGPNDPTSVPSPKPSAKPALDPNDLPQPNLPDASSTLTSLSASSSVPLPPTVNGTRVVQSANTTVTATSAKFPTLGDGTPFTGLGTVNMNVRAP